MKYYIIKASIFKLQTPNITDYDLKFLKSEANEHNSFYYRIERFIEDGWELQGGISVSNDIMYQALIKKD